MAAAHARTDRRHPDRNGLPAAPTVGAALPAPDPSTAAPLRRLTDIPLARRRGRRRLLAAGGAMLSLGLPLVPMALQSETTTVAATAVAPVPSNFDISRYIAPGNNGGTHPADVSHEGQFGTGNFRSICHFSHFAYDDPIVFPGQPGKAHLHMFFGNTTTNASSTYESLRSAGGGTCNGGPINRSGYWVPALMTPSGQAVIPEAIATYYKSAGRDPRQVQAFPAGLRMIAGNDMNNPAAPDSHRWYCEAAQSPDQKYLTIPDCPDNQLLIAQVIYPDCWNGKDLDSADHRSHMAYGVRDSLNRMVCPSSHPVALPEVTFSFFFKHVGPTSGWYVSSDRMNSQMPNGSTFHADWFGAWDPGVQDKWVDLCIHAMRDCQQGQLGDDTSLVWANTYSGPKLVTPPSKDSNNLLNPSPTTTLAPTTSAAATTTLVPTTTSITATTAAPTTTTALGNAPSPVPGPQSSATWASLRIGSTGEYVRRAQSTLARLGYTAVKETSVFDQATADATLTEQKKYGSLADTGTVDWSTGVHLGTFWSSDGSVTTTTPGPTTTTSAVTTTTAVKPTTTTVGSTTTTVTSTTSGPTTTVPSTNTTAFSPKPAKWTSSTWKPLTIGSTGEYVSRAQRTLRKIGYSATVRETGVFDQATFAAVLAEQKKYGSLADTGTIYWATGSHFGIFW